MKGGNMRYLILIVLLGAVLITAGCVSGDNSSVVTPNQTPTPTVTPTVTTLPQVTVVSAPSQTYKKADIVIELNKYPASGFKIDYALRLGI